VSFVSRSYRGHLNCECAHCDALFWFSERSVAATDVAGQCPAHNLCCGGGQIVFPKFRRWPLPLDL
jgi:hypothetical protein